MHPPERSKFIFVPDTERGPSPLESPKLVGFVLDDPLQATPVDNFGFHQP